MSSVSDQFSVYQALHSETCKVAGANCSFAIDGGSMSFWPTYLWFFVAAFGLFLYVRLGLANKLAAIAERQTHRLWLQTLIFVCPPILAGTAFNVLRNIWGLVINPSIVSLEHFCPKFVHFPRKLPECAKGFDLWQAFLSQYLLASISVIMTATFCIYIFLRIFRYAPRKFWLVPALAASAMIIYDGTDLGGKHRSKPLAPDNALVQAVKPMAIQENFPLSQIHVSDNPFMTFFLTGQVAGVGLNKRIIFGMHSAFDDAEIPSHLPAFRSQRVNGFLPSRPTPAMLRSIMGHELAHVKRWHAELTLFLGLSFAWLLCWIAARAVPNTKNWLTGWTALPMYLAALLAVAPVYAAALNAITLVMEYDADRVGLEISKEPDGFAAFAFRSAAGLPLELSLLGRWWTFHPSAGERIRMAIEWQQRNRPDQPLKVPDTKALLIPAKQEQRAKAK